MVYPLAAPDPFTDPLTGIESSCQYEAALAGDSRSVYRPVRMKVSRAPVAWSWTRSTSPGWSLSSAAALVDSAAGMAPPADAESGPGHFPATSSA